MDSRFRCGRGRWEDPRAEQLSNTLLVVSPVLLNLAHNNVVSDHFIKLEWDHIMGMRTIHIPPQYISTVLVLNSQD